MYFLCFRVGEVVGVRLVNLCLKGKYKTICYAMYSKRQSIYFRTIHDGWMDGIMRSTSLACCMEIALEIFHIEFWQISGNHILIVQKIPIWQKWYICWILKFEFGNDAAWKNFWGGYFYQQLQNCKDCKSIFLLFY